MPAKKMAKKTDSGGSCDCGCGSGTMGYQKVTGWVLLILGLLGLLQATGYISLEQYWFEYVWSIIVLIVGVKKAFWCDCCK